MRLDTNQNRTDTSSRSLAGSLVRNLTGPWWMFLLSGIAWLIISVVVLRFNIVSVATVGLLMGAVFLVAAIDEFMIASFRPSWGWAHILMGILYIGGSIWCFVTPFGAFWALATVIGLLLILNGTLEMVTSIANMDVNSAWWLGLIAGILEIGIGFWVSQQHFATRAVFLVIVVGLLAVFRGIFEIALSFELRSLQHR
jgi:uncharacterized membrane protein HdeD (DUF308 family)